MAAHDHTLPAERWVVLPNLRLGLPLAPLRCGRQIFLATDGFTRLCAHGETHSFIAKWKERPRPAHHVCDCSNTDGLCGGPKAAPSGWEAPDYYSVLCAIGTDEITLQGKRTARQIPFAGVDGVPDGTASPAYMSASGSVRCAHGITQTTLIAMRTEKNRRFRRLCNCVPGGWQKGRLGTRRGKRLALPVGGGRPMRGIEGVPRELKRSDLGSPPGIKRAQTEKAVVEVRLCA